VTDTVLFPISHLHEPRLHCLQSSQQLERVLIRDNVELFSVTLS
jgi:hypothetical protein